MMTFYQVTISVSALPIKTMFHHPKGIILECIVLVGESLVPS
jgi:hypothetical protein